eukprot:scaffold7121_cov121-Isochrysis_galbana.AAC.4
MWGCWRFRVCKGRGCGIAAQWEQRRGWSVGWGGGVQGGGIGEDGTVCSSFLVAGHEGSSR